MQCLPIQGQQAHLCVTVASNLTGPIARANRNASEISSSALNFFLESRTSWTSKVLIAGIFSEPNCEQDSLPHPKIGVRYPKEAGMEMCKILNSYSSTNGESKHCSKSPSMHAAGHCMWQLFPCSLVEQEKGSSAREGKAQCWGSLFISQLYVATFHSHWPLQGGSQHINNAYIQ